MVVFMLDYAGIERKWQGEWEKKKIFEGEPNDKESLLVTAAIPYVNMPQHIGHLRTYATADFFSRYMRMRGFNVLYPIGFHMTGTPILAIAKRVSAGDKDLIEELHLFGISDDDIAKMTDPLFIANYFALLMERGMRKAGYSIDWRRKFTTIDPSFSRLVEWQFMMLEEKGLLTKGSHPVGWCTNENNAVGQHDTKHDTQPEIEALTAVKFKEEGGEAYFACATYRPETIYGVTNIFIGDNVEYVRAKINGEQYYLSKDSVSQLGGQLAIEVQGGVAASELLAKNAINPINGDVIPILPGFFVKGDVGTGIVMSVPSHAPFDYAALERLKSSGYPMPRMEYRKILEIEPINGVSLGRSISGANGKKRAAEHPEIPALAYMELLGTDQNSDEMLEMATKQVYREEARWGKMTVGNYVGMGEQEARERIKSDLVRDGMAFGIFVIANSEPVFCRCSTRVIVKMVENQWFINYGDKEWKAKVRENFSELRVFPEKTRNAFDATIGWIAERAAEREQGLGTKFPFNPSHIIESLSDSTIYMLYYTFLPVLNRYGVKPEQLTKEFFNFILLGEGDMPALSKSTAIEEDALKKCKESVDYWYKNTSRHSGPDLIYNHLTMYLFNHVALLPKKFWPKQVVVNGFVNYEGKKMSKSMGNVVPLIQGIEKFGADPLRFIEVVTADLDTDIDFSTETINGIYSRNDYLHGLVMSLDSRQSGGLNSIDYWLYSVLHRKIKEVTKEMQGLSLKSAYTKVYYDSVNEIKWYLERGGSNQLVMREFFEAVVLMLAPAMPHFAEELWHLLGKRELVAAASWPVPNEEMISPVYEAMEEMLKGISEDITHVMGLTSNMDQNRGKRVAAIKLIIAEDWKTQAYNLFADRGDIASVIDAMGGKHDKEALSKFLAPLAKKGHLARIPEASGMDVFRTLTEAAPYLEKKFPSGISVELEGKSSSARASRAMPWRPSIEVVWM